MELEAREAHGYFSFARFAAHPLYTHINRALVQQVLAPFPRPAPGTVLTIVDLACGTGAITHLILEELARQHAPARLFAVDPSLEALQQAQQSLQERGTLVPIEFVQGAAADLPSLVQQADVVFFCNAVHLLPEKRAAFEHIATSLAPGGRLAWNSAFYEGTSLEETRRFSRWWIRRAVGWLRQEHPEVQFSRVTKAPAMQWLTPEAYRQLLTESGFCQVEMSQEYVMLSLESIADLGQYWLFIEGALPGVPVALGAAALGRAVYQAGQELGMTEVPRQWLHVIATKGGGG
jgi:ubiquinone/menaquinone biosynthesis C-methylase UbiE